jgi:hypothetical protein
METVKRDGRHSFGFVVVTPRGTGLVLVSGLVAKDRVNLISSEPARSVFRVLGHTYRVATQLSP